MRFQLHKNFRKFLLDMRFFYLNHSLSLTSTAKPGSFEIPVPKGNFPESTGGKCTIYACCDAGYYTKYAKAFMGSIVANAPGHPMHMHIVNPDADILGELEALKEVTPECPISYTWEDLSLAHANKEETGIYYYTIRFLRLYQLMSASQTSCLCLDIDALLNSSGVNNFLTQLESSDVAFYSRFKKFSGSTKLLAGTLFVNNSPAGRCFVSNAGRQIDRFISAGHLMEKMDQQILYRSYLKAKKEFKNLRFVDLAYPVIDLDFTDNGLVWYPKGQSKNEAKYQSRERGYADTIKARLAG